MRATSDRASLNYVPPEDRIATFDQDGTLWAEHPFYTQAMFALDRMHEMAPQHPEWHGGYISIHTYHYILELCHSQRRSQGISPVAQFAANDPRRRRNDEPSHDLDDRDAL
jgi:hypothetical protein